MQPFFYLFTIFIVLLGRALFANPDFWKYRDDSVIHLSHAKNFALFGTIGLSAGDRTEAMSSPLNYLISQAWYVASPNTTFENYLNVYLVLTLLVLSGSWVYLLISLFRYLKISPKSIPGIGITIVPIILVTSSWTTFGWIVSGMENALAASLLFLIIGQALQVERSKNSILKLLIFLFGVTRIELAVLVFPLMIYLIGLKKSTKEHSNKFRGAKAQIMNLMPIIVGWAVFHLFRYLYFGSIYPNTATALGKSTSASMVCYLMLQTMFVFIVLGKNFKIQKIIPVQCALFLLIIDIFLSSKSGGNFHFIPASFAVGLLFLWILLLPKISTYPRQTLIFFLVILLPLNEYFLFGPARLSEFRIVSMFVPPIVLLATGIIVSNLKSDLRCRVFIGAILFMTPIASFALTKVDFERNLCCAISPSDQIILSAARHFNEINDLPKSTNPIVASPDLGKVSFSKTVMNVDLGLIGDPLLSKIALESPQLLPSYLLNFVSPDLLESHGYWSCRYESLIELPQFQSEYRVLTRRKVSSEFNVPVQEQCFDHGTYTIWIKDISIRELTFLKKLSHTSNSGIAEQVRSEINYCKGISDELFRCQYVYRAVLRNMNRIEMAKGISRITQAFKYSPTYDLDRTRLLKDPGWAKKAFKLLNQVS